MIKIDQSHLVQVAVGKALTFKNSTTIACYQTVNQKPKKKQQIENSIKKKSTWFEAMHARSDKRLGINSGQILRKARIALRIYDWCD